MEPNTQQLESDSLDYERAVKLWTLAKEQELLDKEQKKTNLKAKIEKDREDFFNAPDFDAFRFKMMFKQIQQVIDNSDFSKPACFYPPTVQKSVYYFFTTYECHPWWKHVNQISLCPVDSYPIGIQYTPNLYVKYVLEEVEKHKFKAEFNYPPVKRLVFQWQDTDGYKFTPVIEKSEDSLEKYVNEMFLEHGSCTIDFLCEKGKLDELVFINNSNKFHFSWSQSNMIKAIENGHLDVVKWLYLNRKGWDISEAKRIATELQDSEILRFFTRNEDK